MEVACKKRMQELADVQPQLVVGGTEPSEDKIPDSALHEDHNLSSEFKELEMLWHSICAHLFDY